LKSNRKPLTLLFAMAILLLFTSCSGNGALPPAEAPESPDEMLIPSEPPPSAVPSAGPPAAVSPEPSYHPDELVLTLNGGSGEELDTLILTIDGVLPDRPLEAVYRAGRIRFDGEALAGAFSGEWITEADVSLFAFCEANGLTADFNWEQGSISLFSGYSRPGQRAAGGTGDALLRLEDIAALGARYYHPDELIKLRAMSDLLWEYGAAFSIAWVPYYIRPADDYVSDVTREYTRCNAEFVFTADYMISRGGVLGLHGYSHQSGRQNSIAGTEFGPGVNDSDEATRERYELAIEAAAALEWTPHFFEYPHYASTKRQNEILEEYFDIIYTRPFNKWPGRPYYVERGDRTIVYLHTPQDHVHSGREEHVAEMISRIRNAGTFCSLYYHPYLDYGYISIHRSQAGPPVIEYMAGSPLRRILEAFEAGGRVARTPMHFLP
jgi:hypothetical protein